MKEIQGRVTISRCASKKVMRRKEFGLLEEQYSVDSWYLWITRLYSAADYSEGEYRLKHGPLSMFEKYVGGRYKTKSGETFHPIHASSLGLIPGVTKKPEGKTKIFYGLKFYIAVKELIIEWEDYQAEISGYVHCGALEDPIYQSDWFNNADDFADEGIYQNSNDSKQLLRFVKSPGLRTTNIKVGKEDLDFFPIQLNRCRVDDYTLIEEEIVVENLRHESKTYLQVLREHHLELEIRQLFDNDLREQTLPIQNAHITVEIYLQ